MVISFSFSFPALFFTWVFLVSTHTTLSFTSDLDAHISTQTCWQLGMTLLFFKAPHPERRLTLGCPGRPVSCPGRGTVGAPGRSAPGWAVSPTWGCPTPASPAQSRHVARGNPCLLACPLLCRWPAWNWPPPPPASFLSRPLPAWLSDQYLHKGCDVSLGLACFVAVTDAPYLHLFVSSRCCRYRPVCCPLRADESELCLLSW